MNFQPLEAHLCKIDNEVDSLAKSVLMQQPAPLVNAASSLQALTVSLSKALVTLPDKNLLPHPLRLRLQAISAKLNVVREGMVRQNVGVERALVTLVPATECQTYTPKLGGYGRQAFGGAGQKSGEFRSLSV